MEEFDKLRQLLIADRSVRRFRQQPIGRETLHSLVELTRYCASGRNLQPLRYRIVSDPEQCSDIFPYTKWAGYLTDWDGPALEERPVAYLVQCLDTALTTNCLCDDGLQLQAITLGATALGLGACIIKSFNAERICSILSLPEHLRPLYVVALGYPAEKIELEDMAADGDFRYYRTPNQIHHVPKRKLSQLIISD
ncbi:MAG: nitroreductase family protein [Bacteroidales bacterium]|nr:nitroreductase family protein [Bacteroidales bacterium]